MTISPTIRFHFLKKISLKDRRLVRSSLNAIFVAEHRPMSELQYIFCSDKYILDINWRFLGHDYYTDIVTFPLSEPRQPIVAEIYISVDRVKENAGEFGVSFQEELLRVMFHGALHLCGHGDKTAGEQRKMRQLENKYLKRHFVSRETNAVR